MTGDPRSEHGDSADRGRQARPKARTRGLVVEDLGDESLVFDSDTNTAHCLSPTAARVWRACNGGRGASSLARLTATSEGLVADALAELSGLGLLDPGSAGPAVPLRLGVEATSAEPAVPSRPGAEAAFLSRRRALKRIGAAGLAATAAPLIVSAAVGTPLAAASAGSLCAPCTGIGPTDTCGPGSHCDPASLVCIPSACNSADSLGIICASAGASCGGGIAALGTCTAGCPTTGFLCCT
jgi:hypothetical protein